MCFQSNFKLDMVGLKTAMLDHSKTLFNALVIWFSGCFLAFSLTSLTYMYYHAYEKYIIVPYRGYREYILRIWEE